MSKPKVPAPIYKQLQTWFVDLIWPWIVKNIWPEVEKLVVAAFVTVVYGMRDSIAEWFAKFKDDREQAAKQKATEAERMAKTSQSPLEAEKYEAIAQVWHEVAEQYRQENELLKAELDAATNKAASDFRGETDQIGLEDIIEVGEDDSLRLRGSGSSLQLPDTARES